jgi:hypothetical protein
MQTRFKRFFSVDSPKAIKANDYGWLNAINYMAPASTAGMGNFCSHASDGCKAICLGEHSGQAAMRREGEDNAVTLSRKNKIVYFMQDRQAFIAEAIHHIRKLDKQAIDNGLRLAVRLNGSTDIAWEGIRDAEGLTIFDHFPTIQFLDYTKNPTRFKRKLPSNYHLTFSRSETNETQCKALLAQGHNVAVIFSEGLPYAMWGFNVINGDDHDLRFLDPKGVVVGLTPKGAKAKRDVSGFVLRDY